MSLWSRKFLNEAEAGTPETSEYGQQFWKSGMSFRNKDTLLPYIRSGVHPSSTIDGGMFGTVARGMEIPPPVVPYHDFYMGEYPLTQQPKLDKPYPWE